MGDGGRRLLGREVWLVVLIGLMLNGVAVWMMGQSAAWDLLNYHYYNPYALLEGRHGFDLGVGQRQTYHNPLLNLLPYLAIRKLPSPWDGIVIGWLQVPVFVGLYLIARVLLRSQSGPLSTRYGALLLALAGWAAPVQVWELGKLRGDTLSAGFVLLGLFAALVARRRGAGGLLFLGGVLVGLATGGKPTNGIFVLGLAGALFLVPSTRGRLRDGSLALVGAVAGALLAGGWWWLRMWERFGNPIFPQLNDLFRSPWAPPARFANTTFLGSNLVEVVFYPLLFNQAGAGMEIHNHQFHDLRLPLLLVLFLGVAVSFLVRQSGKEGRAPEDTGEAADDRFLLWFAFISYVVWLMAFSIWRYAATLEMLAPIFFVAALRRIGLRGTGLTVLTGVLILALALSWHRPPHERVAWAEDWFAVEFPDPEELEGALVLVGGEAPLSFIVPAAPPSARFVRIGGNLFYESDYQDLDQRYAHAMGEAIQKAVAEQAGPLFLLYAEQDVAAARREASWFGLEPAEGAEPRVVQARVGPKIQVLPLRRR